MDIFESYAHASPIHPESHAAWKASAIPEAIVCSATQTALAKTSYNDLISFLSYIRTQNIPIIPVTKSDVRSVLGQGATFLVNSAELPETYVDPVSGRVFPQGMMVAMKRAKVNKNMEDPVAGRLRVIFDDLLILHHPPLSAHPNIVDILGISFDTEGLIGNQNAVPVLIMECAELGNLAEVLETARKEGRPLNFDDKMSLCIDIAHGLEVLHSCDIVHGDVKCENALVFEREIDFKTEDAHDPKTELSCKLTDFGASQSLIRKVWVGGSQPWQAPECLKGEYLELEHAKRTDIYSFGMLLWRVFLDGDPFNLLGNVEGKNVKERRQCRNDVMTEIKDKDELVQHVCDSLALSDKLSGFQLEILCKVIKITLVKDSYRRELDLTRIIRLLTPDNRYQARHPVTPERLVGDAKYPLLDLETWYSELENASPVVHYAVTSGFRLYVKRLSDQEIKSHDEIRTAVAAAYQLATCHANGFGVSFQPEKCLDWLLLAAEHGLQQASYALPNVTGALHMLSGASGDDTKEAAKKSATISELWAQGALRENTAVEPLTSDYDAVAEMLPIDARIVTSTSTLLNASENCKYDDLESLLAASVVPIASEDGVSSIHFLSFWSLEKAKALGSRLVLAGADINALAKHSALIKGTPLMWSVHRDCLEHSSILLALGADPTILTDDGDDSLSYAARLHRISHLRMLLESLPLVKFRGCIGRLIEAAASSQSPFARMKMHGENWQSEAIKTLQLLQGWNALMPDSTDFKDLVLQALHGSLKAKYGRKNSDVQISFIKETSIHQLDLRNLLRESVLTFNVELFESLLDYGVPINCLDKHKKSLLHLCAKIPDHATAATEFAPRLLDRGAELDAQDKNGSTPWMDAALGRKWYLADFLIQSGANPRVTNSEGFNIFGLCIKTVNLGTIKYLLKYCKEGQNIRQDSFLVNRDKKISALQLAAALPQLRAHSMKLEAIGIFLIILKNVISDPPQLNFRSSGVLPNATALDIAASLGNVHMVKYLVKRGAHHSLEDRASVLAVIKSKRSETTCCLRKKNLERCAFIVENWDRDTMRARELAEDWTNMRTMDESFIKSSWEPVKFSYYSRKKVEKANYGSGTIAS